MTKGGGRSKIIFCENIRAGYSEVTICDTHRAKMTRIIVNQWTGLLFWWTVVGAIRGETLTGKSFE